MRRAAAALALFATLAVALPALARTTREVAYAKDRVWPTAVRYLRVDAGARIVEKDETAGYVLFELTADGKAYPGSLELVPTRDGDGREATKLILSIPGRPSYVEDVMLERLEQKLRDELGPK